MQSSLAISGMNTIVSIQAASSVLVNMRYAKIPLATSAILEVEMPLPVSMAVIDKDIATDSTLSSVDSTAQPPHPQDNLKSLKRGRDVDRSDLLWNVNVRPHSGGIPSNSEQNLEKDALNALMGLNGYMSTKTHAAPSLNVVYCMNVVPGDFPLAKWPINPMAKEFASMEAFKKVAFNFNPNTNGIVHPYLGLSHVKIPVAIFEMFLVATFTTWAKPRRGFYNMASSIGLSIEIQKIPKTAQVGEGTIEMVFSPIAYNKNGYRLCTVHGRKPKITRVKCMEECCKDKWTDAKWATVMNEV
jgi:hypothetical protein